MAQSKKIFIAVFVIFLILLFYVSYDISRRTSFPGSKSQLKERLKERYVGEDSLYVDTIETNDGKK